MSDDVVSTLTLDVSTTEAEGKLTTLATKIGLVADALVALNKGEGQQVGTTGLQKQADAAKTAAAGITVANKEIADSAAATDKAVTASTTHVADAYKQLSAGARNLTRDINSGLAGASGVLTQSMGNWTANIVPQMANAGQAAGKSFKSSLAAGVGGTGIDYLIPKTLQENIKGHFGKVGEEGATALAKGFTDKGRAADLRLKELFDKNTAGAFASIQTLVTKANDELSKVGAQSAKAKFGNLALDATFLKDVRTAQEALEKGRQTAALYTSEAKAGLAEMKQRQQAWAEYAATVAKAMQAETLAQAKSLAFLAAQPKVQASQTLRAAIALDKGYDLSKHSTEALDAARSLGSVNAAKAALDALSVTHTNLGPKIQQTTEHQKQWNSITSESHALARGLSGSLGALWMTYGQMLPLLAGAALGAGFKEAAKSGSEFAYQLTFVKALGGETAAAMDRLSDSSLSLAKTGLHAPVDIANGYRILAQAGLEAADALKVMPHALNLATVGEMNMEQAGIALVGVMNAFGLTANSAEHVGDVFAKAAAVSQTSVQGMTEAMKYASVVGSQYGVSMEDTATAISLLAKVNITGTAAGTSFRNMIKELYAPTKEAASVLKKLGVDTADAEGKLRPFTDIIYDLKGKLEQFDKGSQVKLEQKIFGERGGKEVAQMLSLTREEWDKLQKSISESDGFASSVARQLEETTKGKWIQALNTLKTTFIEAFKEMEPAFSKLAEGLKSTFDNPAFSAGLKNIVQSMLSTMTMVVSLGDVLLTGAKAWVTYKAAMIGASLWTAASTFVTTSSAVIGLQGALAAASGAMGPVAAGTTAVTSVLGRLSASLVALPNPLTVIAGLLIGGVTAWALWGDSASRAGDKAFDSAKRAEDALTQARKREKYGVGSLAEAQEALDAAESLLKLRIEAKATGTTLTDARSAVTKWTDVVAALEAENYKASGSLGGLKKAVVDVSGTLSAADLLGNKDKSTSKLQSLRDQLQAKKDLSEETLRASVAEESANTVSIATQSKLEALFRKMADSKGKLPESVIAEANALLRLAEAIDKDTELTKKNNEAKKAAQAVEAEREKQRKKFLDATDNIAQQAEKELDAARATRMYGDVMQQTALQAAKFAIEQKELNTHITDADKLARLAASGMLDYGKSLNTIEQSVVASNKAVQDAEAEGLLAVADTEARKIAIWEESARKKIELAYQAGVAGLDASAEAGPIDTTKYKELEERKQAALVGIARAAQSKLRTAELKDWVGTVNSIDKVFHDGWMKIGDQGVDTWKQMADTMKKTFKTAVLEYIYKEMARPFVLNVIANLAGMTGLDGLAGAAGAAGGASGAVSGISSLYSVISNLGTVASNIYSLIQGGASGVAGGALSSAGSYLGNASVQAFGSGLSLGANASIEAATTYHIAALNAEAAGDLVLAAQYTQTANSLSAGASVSAGVSVVGWMAAAFLAIDWLESRGGGPKTVIGATVTDDKTTYFNPKPEDAPMPWGSVGDVGIGDNSSGGTLGPLGPGDWLYDQSMSEAVQRSKDDQAIETILKGLRTDAANFVKQIGGTLGNVAASLTVDMDPYGDAPNTLSYVAGNYSGARNGDRDNTSEDIKLESQRIFLGLISSATDLAPVFTDIVKGMDLSKASAEQMTAAIDKFVAIDAVRDAFDIIGIGAEHVTTSLINAAGGTDALAGSVAKYYENFYTPAEKAAVQAAQTAKDTASLTKSFSDLGFALPTSAAGFRSIGDQLLAMGPAGEVAFVKLMGLSDSFLKLVPAIDAVSGMTEKQIQDMQKAANSSLSFANAKASYNGASSADLAGASLANLEQQMSIMTDGTLHNFSDALNLSSDGFSKLDKETQALVLQVISSADAYRKAQLDMAKAQGSADVNWAVSSGGNKAQLDLSLSEQLLQDFNVKTETLNYGVNSLGDVLNLTQEQFNALPLPMKAYVQAVKDSYLALQQANIANMQSQGSADTAWAVSHGANSEAANLALSEQLLQGFNKEMGTANLGVNSLADVLDLTQEEFNALPPAMKPYVQSVWNAKAAQDAYTASLKKTLAQNQDAWNDNTVASKALAVKELSTAQTNLSAAKISDGHGGYIDTIEEAANSQLINSLNLDEASLNLINTYVEANVTLRNFDGTLKSASETAANLAAYQRQQLVKNGASPETLAAFDLVAQRNADKLAYTEAFTLALNKGLDPLKTYTDSEFSALSSSNQQLLLSIGTLAEKIALPGSKGYQLAMTGNGGDGGDVSNGGWTRNEIDGLLNNDFSQMWAMSQKMGKSYAESLDEQIRMAKSAINQANQQLSTDPNNGYNQIMRAEAKRALEALQGTKEIYLDYERQYKGHGQGLTEWQGRKEDALNQLTFSGNNTPAARQAIEDAFAQEFEDIINGALDSSAQAWIDFAKGINDSLASLSMSGVAKQLYDINKAYEDNVKAAKEMADATGIGTPESIAKQQGKVDSLQRAKDTGEAAIEAKKEEIKRLEAEHVGAEIYGSPLMNAREELAALYAAYNDNNDALEAAKAKLAALTAGSKEYTDALADVERLRTAQIDKMRKDFGDNIAEQGVTLNMTGMQRQLYDLAKERGTSIADAHTLDRAKGEFKQDDGAIGPLEQSARDLFKAKLDKIQKGILDGAKYAIETSGLNSVEKAVYDFDLQMKQEMEDARAVDQALAFEKTGGVLTKDTKIGTETQDAVAAKAAAMRLQMQKNFLDPIKDSIATMNMSAVEKQIWDLNKAYEENRKSALALGLSTAEVDKLYQASLEKMQADFMKPVNYTLATAGMSDMEKQVYDLNEAYKQQLADAEALGLGFADFLKITAANAMQLQKMRDDFMKPIDYTIATIGMSDMEKQVYDLNEAYKQQLKDAIALGASEEELGRIRQANALQMQKLQDDYITSMTDQQWSLGLSAHEKAIQDITKAYEENTAAGTALGLGDIYASNLYRAQLIDLAKSELRTAYDRESQALQTTIDRLTSFTDAIKKFRETLKTGDLAQLSPEAKLAATKADFEKTAADAQALRLAGDTEGLSNIQGDLQSTAQAYLDASKAYNASSAGYFTTLSQVDALLATLESGSTGTLDTAKLQLEQLKTQVGALITLDESVRSVADAIADLRAAKLLPYAEALNRTGLATPTMSVVGTTLGDKTKTASDMAQYMSNMGNMGIAPEVIQASLTAELLKESESQTVELKLISSAQDSWGGKIHTELTQITRNTSSAKLDPSTFALFSNQAYWNPKFDAALTVIQNTLSSLNIQSSWNSSIYSVLAAIQNNTRFLPGQWSDLSNIWLPSFHSLLYSIKTNTASNTGGGSLYPAYASGGSYQGGVALVGEEGPELINFQNPGQVYTAAQTSNLLNSGSDNREVVAELKALIRLQSAANQQLIARVQVMAEQISELRDDMALVEQSR